MRFLKNKDCVGAIMQFLWQVPSAIGDSVMTTRPSHGLMGYNHKSSRDLVGHFVLSHTINSSPPGEDVRHLANVIFRRIFLNENVRISMQISLKCVPKGPVDNKSALVHVMVWRRTGDKPLPEAMMNQFTEAY